jgi:hypothetical protein
VRHGRCQPRDTAPPTPLRLTRRALEGGPATPSNRFLVILQGQVVTLGRLHAIPATVDPVRPPPYLQRHAWRCRNHSGAVRHAGTGRRHACHCTPYGSTSTATSSPSEDATVNHYAPDPRSCHCSGTRRAMMTRSWQGPSRRPPTPRRHRPYFLM